MTSSLSSSTSTCPSTDGEPDSERSIGPIQATSSSTAVAAAAVAAATTLQEPAYLLGTAVRKWFLDYQGEEGRFYTGWIRAHNKHNRQNWVVYEDGDSEELNDEQIEEVLHPMANGTYPTDVMIGNSDFVAHVTTCNSPSIGYHTLYQ